MKSYVLRASGFIHLLLLMLSVSFNTGLSAQNAPQQATLSVQGVLTRSDGTAVDDGQYPVTFRLFDAATGGNMVHSEPVTVETIGGVYSVVLGKQSAFPMNAPFDKTYYLSVLIGSTELLPRPQLTHAPYALSILGQNNRFTSTGPIIGDAFRAKGGAPTGGLGPNANGFAFQAPGGDEGGGLFSDGANNIQIWAGGAQKGKFTNSVNELYGQTNTNALTTYGPLSCTNNLSVSGTSTINGEETVQSNLNANGNIFANKKVLTPFRASGPPYYGDAAGGYSFQGDGAYDSGMFGVMDGNFVLVSNGQERITIGNDIYIAAGGDAGLTAQNSVVFACGGGGNFYMANLKAKSGSGNFKNIQVDLSTSKVVYDNSSRRFKSNIRPLVDDFSLILKAQPRVYNRLDNDTTYNELGYIAEEMDSIGLHKLVQHDQNGVIDGFDYDKMILYTVEVLKTQDAAITQLKAELAALKAENANLQQENSTLRTDNNALQQQQASFGNQLELLTKRMNLLENAGAEHNRK